jgi:type VI secretion system protein ImpF
MPEYVLSVLDRLYDDAPDEPEEPRPRWFGTREDIKQSVLTNLGWVLNARRCLVEVPDGRDHLRRSVLAYGLPDFAPMSMETDDQREELRAAIESAIRRFEPRLSRVTVGPPEPEPSSRNLRFQVDAMLVLRPAPEFVSFDSVLLLPARAFELRG